MAETSGFFASVSGDRAYTSDWLAKYIAAFIGNGVYNGELGVTADGSAMAVTLPSGRAWINGYHYRNDGDMTLTIDNADGVLNRIDIVVLRWDINARSITAQVIKGTPASTATAPAITRTVEQYDLKLAEISIPAGTTAITQSLITDTRLDNDACGIVHGVVQQVDTTTLYNQIQNDLAEFKSVNETDFSTWSAGQQADFAAWYDGIKDILDESTAGNLLNMIQTHEADSVSHVTQADHDKINGAVQSATVGGTAVPKNDGVLDFPMPTAEQVVALPNSASIGDCIDDFNSGNALKPGIYGFNPYTANSPYAGYGIVIVRTYKQKDNFWIWQEVYSTWDLSQHLIRNKINAGAWSSWLKPDANKADYASGSIPLATPGLRNITMSTAEPSGGQDGDMWIQYS